MGRGLFCTFFTDLRWSELRRVSGILQMCLFMSGTRRSRTETAQHSDFSVTVIDRSSAFSRSQLVNKRTCFFWRRCVFGQLACVCERQHLEAMCVLDFSISSTTKGSTWFTKGKGQRRVCDLGSMSKHVFVRAQFILGMFFP